jgi:hypothetical protein
VELVSGFRLLLQGRSATMTAPPFANLTTVLTGWVFASRHTITRVIPAAGETAEKHFSSYHRLFNAAHWSLDALGLSGFTCSPTVPTMARAYSATCLPNAISRADW